ncbi:hypothetical protein [Mycolicibacterium aromaticivorans]|uniref:hypothetical protein n=1 Tax=Mycolicibacterium aromaticivorans TaxID=318425 RepID=UPI00103E2C1A|nr:hypothetical protein [Mycolicibacterium aromaticivorans]
MTDRGPAPGPLVARTERAAGADAAKSGVSRPDEARLYALAGDAVDALAESEGRPAPTCDAPLPESAAATPDPAHAATPNPTPAAPTLSHCRTAKLDDRRLLEFAPLSITTPLAHAVDN